MAPKHIDRWKHFFGLLPAILKDKKEVKDLTEVRDTLVPLIKMKFDGVDIDIAFARVMGVSKVGPEFTTEMLLSNDVLR